MKITSTVVKKKEIQNLLGKLRCKSFVKPKILFRPWYFDWQSSETWGHYPTKGYTVYPFYQEKLSYEGSLTDLNHRHHTCQLAEPDN